MAAVKARHPQNIPASYYKPVGQMIVRWGFTELYMQSIIWHVWKLKDAKSARALTWNLNAVEKVKLIGALSPRWISDPMDQRELKEIHAEAERLRVKRNHLAHAVWGYVPGNRKQMLMFYLRELDQRIMPKASRPSVADIKEWAADLDALNSRLKRFHKKLGAPHP